MKASFTKTVGAASIALLTLASAASAEDREFSWSVTATGTSDYVFRGLSLNDEDPAFQASIDGSYGIFYMGLWGSMVDGDIYEPVELDWYAGIRPELGPVTFDFGFVYYFYPWGEPSDANLVELKAGASFSPVDKLTLTPVFWYIPDQDNSDEAATIEGTVAYELPQVGIFTPKVSGLYGWTENYGLEEYSYWNAGLALSVEKFTFDFRYWDTDLDDGGGLADERFVFTASVTLP